MGKFSKLLKTTVKSQYIEFVFDPAGSNIIVSEINRHGEREDGGKAKVLYWDQFSDFVLALEVPVEALKALYVLAEVMAGDGNYPRTLEEAVPVGSQYPMGGDSAEPPGEPGDEEVVACPLCDNDELLVGECERCEGTGQVPKSTVEGPLAPGWTADEKSLAPDPDPEKTLLVEGKWMTKQEAKEASGF